MLNSGQRWWAGRIRNELHVALATKQADAGRRRRINAYSMHIQLALLHSLCDVSCKNLMHQLWPRFMKALPHFGQARRFCGHQAEQRKPRRRQDVGEV